MLIAVAGVSGCQSGPRFAWWKRDQAPDSSAVARSAETALPSAQSTPQAVAVAGLTPAAPPSSTNLAVAGTPAAPTTPPNIAIPATSSTTLANAPLASYPDGNSLADKITTPSGSASPAHTPFPPAATSASAAFATMPAAALAAGPYDPNGYKPPLASTGAQPAGAASADTDRYGIPSMSAAGASASDRYAASTPTAVTGSFASPTANRYSAEPLSASPATVPASSPLAAQAPASSDDRYAVSSAPPAANPAQPAPTPITAVSPMPVAAAPLPNTPAVATSGIQLTSAPGQYRPGGTSNYTGYAATPSVEIATRPAPPSATNPLTAPSTLPAATSEPWAPPVTNGTRTY